MRYEHVIQTPCPKCGAPVVQFETFCCYRYANRSCIKCGFHDAISLEEYYSQHLTHPNISGGSDKVWIHIINPAEMDEWEKSIAKHSPLHNYHLKEVTGDEAAAFRKQLEECGYDEVKGPQIGFLGNKQVFDPPIQL